MFWVAQKRLAKEARAQEVQAKNASLGKKVKEQSTMKGMKGRGEASFYRVTCKVWYTLHSMFYLVFVVSYVFLNFVVVLMCFWVIAKILFEGVNSNDSWLILYAGQWKRNATWWYPKYVRTRLVVTWQLMFVHADLNSYLNMNKYLKLP